MCSQALKRVIMWCAGYVLSFLALCGALTIYLSFRWETGQPSRPKSSQSWKHWALGPVWVTMAWCEQQNSCVVQQCSKLLVSYASVAPEWWHNSIITCCTTIREMRCLRHKIHMGLFCAFGLSALHWIISKSIPGKQKKIYGFIHNDLKI